MTLPGRLSELTGTVCPAQVQHNGPLNLSLIPPLLQKEEIREKSVEALKTEFAGDLRFSRRPPTPWRA